MLWGICVTFWFLVVDHKNCICRHLHSVDLKKELGENPWILSAFLLKQATLFALRASMTLAVAQENAKVSTKIPAISYLSSLNNLGYIPSVP